MFVASLLTQMTQKKRSASRRTQVEGVQNPPAATAADVTYGGVRPV